MTPKLTEDELGELEALWKLAETGHTDGWHNWNTAAFKSFPRLLEMAKAAPDMVMVPRRFLADFIQAIDWHGGHGTPSLDRPFAEILNQEARAMLAAAPKADGEGAPHERA